MASIWLEDHIDEFDADVVGVRHAGGVHISHTQDSIKDLDALGMPAWDLIDFDVYANRINMMNMLKGKRYATLFTSRGCPYLCNYCHEIFGKRPGRGFLGLVQRARLFGPRPSGYA